MSRTKEYINNLLESGVDFFDENKVDDSEYQIKREEELEEEEFWYEHKLKEIGNNMEKAIDLSWMWHCSDNPKNVMDYSFLVEDKNLAAALTRAAAMGFRTAMRKMEDLGIIEMQDIDRSPKLSDQETWDEEFKEEE